MKSNDLNPEKPIGKEHRCCAAAMMTILFSVAIAFYSIPQPIGMTSPTSLACKLNATSTKSAAILTEPNKDKSCQNHHSSVNYNAVLIAQPTTVPIAQYRQ